jgi:hypothetical protein
MTKQHHPPTQIGMTIEEENEMSIINKLTGLHTRKDVEEIVEFSKSEVKRLQRELLLNKLLLSNAYFRDPDTGRLLKKGVMPKKRKGR